jgi:hypothetical protein
MYTSLSPPPPKPATGSFEIPTGTAEVKTTFTKNYRSLTGVCLNLKSVDIYVLL